MFKQSWSSRLTYTYGITSADYNKMLKEQDNLCAICRKPPEKVRLSVDHNHASKRVRGLLCFRCNTILGLALDSEIIIRNALDYITKHNEIDKDWNVEYVIRKLQDNG